MDRFKIKRKSLVKIEPFEEKPTKDFHSDLKLNRCLSHSEKDITDSVETNSKTNAVRRKSVVVTEPLLECFVTLKLDELPNKSNKKTYAEFYLKNKKIKNSSLNDNKLTDKQILELDYVFGLFDSDQDRLLNESKTPYLDLALLSFKKRVKI